MKKILFSVLITAFFSACSFQKRHYTSGYHITKHRNVVKPEENKVTISNTEKAQELVFPPLMASLQNDLGELKKEIGRRRSIFDSVPQRKGCDTVYFRTGGDKVAGRVEEISPTEVKYRKCNNPEGPLFVVNKSDVLRIKYENGYEEIINQPAPVKNQVSTSNGKPKTDKKGRPVDPSKPSQKRLFIPALLSMIFGFASVVSLGGAESGMLFFVLFSLGALIMGIISLKQIKKNPDIYKGKGMAITGIICGGINLIITLFILFIALLFLI